MHSVGGPDAGSGCFSHGGLAREAALLHVTALVVVHFFSGYRRHGDLHQIVEHHALSNGVQVFMLSVDLCMQKQSADLASPGAVSWWKQRMASGQIVSLGGGPPCETYTAARFQQLETAPGPRPVRSGTHPWGLPALTRRERHQVWIGDKLLFFLIEMLAIAASLGYSGFLEHPQYPLWCAKYDPASIWSLPAIKWLKQLSCTSLISFDQCICGAAGRKPTTLMLIRLPAVRSALLLAGQWGRCNHGAGAHDGLIGHDAQGNFNTAKAKVYPPGLNEVLGRAMCSFAFQFAAQQTCASLPTELQPFNFNLFADDDDIQPDYHGG